MGSVDIKETLFKEWIKKLEEAANSPRSYVECLNIDTDLGEEKKYSILTGGWFSVLDELTEGWDQNDGNEEKEIIKKSKWEEVLIQNEKLINSFFDKNKKLNKNTFLQNAYKESSFNLNNINEPYFGLSDQLTNVNFKIINNKTIQIPIEYPGFLNSEPWFRVELDDNKTFEPTVDFIGILTLLNIPKEDFVKAMKKSGFLTSKYNLKKFLVSMESSYQEYLHDFGDPVIDSSSPPSVKITNFIKWLEELYATYDSLATIDGLYVNINLSGEELMYLAERISSAKFGEVSDPIKNRYLNRILIGAGARLYDESRNYLRLDAPLMTYNNEEIQFDQERGDDVDISFPAIDSEYSCYKISRLIEEEKKKNIDLSESIISEINNLVPTSWGDNQLSVEDKKRIKELGLVPEVKEPDLRFPPNPYVLDYFSTKDGHLWKTKKGVPSAHAIFSSFPDTVVSSFIDKNPSVISITNDNTGDTTSHLIMRHLISEQKIDRIPRVCFNKETLNCKNKKGETPLKMLFCSTFKTLPDVIIKNLEDCEVSWCEERFLVAKGRRTSLAERFNLSLHSFVERERLLKATSARLGRKNDIHNAL